jgi:hypothetical protein
MMLQVRDSLRGATLDALLEAHPKTRQVGAVPMRVLCRYASVLQCVLYHCASVLSVWIVLFCCGAGSVC